MLAPGDPAPWFTAATSERPDYNFSSVAGRYVVLCFFGSAADPAVATMLHRLREATDVFDGTQAIILGVSNDPRDAERDILRTRPPGYRVFRDFRGELARRYGLIEDAAAPGPGRLRPCSFVLDFQLRVVRVVPLTDPAAHAGELIAATLGLPRLDAPELGGLLAPVLTVPRVFEPEFCTALMDYFQRQGGVDSGVMRTDPGSGRTVGVLDHRFKRRQDCLIADRALVEEIRSRIGRRLLPMIQRAFQFRASRIERFIIARYDAADGGRFSAHRDNTTRGTAHRRFAVTINLNAEDYEDGELRFPEYGRRTYRAPTGGAVVFSCSLLHEATPVTRGVRYCVLPFLYDEPGAQLRAENLQYLTAGGESASRGLRAG